MTPSEVVAGADIGRHSLTVEGRACTKFFDFKDGLPVRIDCAG